MSSFDFPGASITVENSTLPSTKGTAPSRYFWSGLTFVPSVSSYSLLSQVLSCAFAHNGNKHSIAIISFFISLML